MKINMFAGLDKKFLLETAKGWEAKYFETKDISNWKGYLQIMRHLGKVADIPLDIKLEIRLAAYEEGIRV